MPRASTLNDDVRSSSTPTTIARRFIAGFAWNLLGTLALQGGTFAANLLVANALGVNPFGQYSIIVATTQMMAGLFQLATATVVTKFIAEHRAVTPEKASQALGLCLRINIVGGWIGMGILLGGSSIFAMRLLGSDKLSWIFMAAAPAVLFTLLTSVQLAAIAGFEEFKQSALALSALMIVQIVSSALAAIEYGLNGAVIAMTLNLALRALVTRSIMRRAVVRHQIGLKYQSNAFTRSIVMQYIVPGSLSGFTAGPAIWFASVSLADTANSFEQIAFLNAALALRTAFVLLPSIMNSVSLSMLSATIGLGERRDFRLVLGMSAFVAVVLAACTTLLILFAGDLMLRLYGQAFVAATPVLHILLISTVCEIVYLPFLQALMSKGHVWKVFLFVMMPRDAVIAGLSYVLAKSQGAPGVAWAFGIGWTMALIATFVLSLICLHLFDARPRGRDVQDPA